MIPDRCKAFNPKERRRVPPPPSSAPPLNLRFRVYPNYSGLIADWKTAEDIRRRKKSFQPRAPILFDVFLRTRRFFRATLSEIGSNQDSSGSSA